MPPGLTLRDWQPPHRSRSGRDRSYQVLPSRTSGKFPTTASVRPEGRAGRGSLWPSESAGAVRAGIGRGACVVAAPAMTVACVAVDAPAVATHFVARAQPAGIGAVGRDQVPAAVVRTDGIPARDTRAIGGVGAALADPAAVVAAKRSGAGTLRRSRAPAGATDANLEEETLTARIVGSVGDVRVGALVVGATLDLAGLIRTVRRVAAPPGNAGAAAATHLGPAFDVVLAGQARISRADGPRRIGAGAAVDATTAPVADHPARIGRTRGQRRAADRHGPSRVTYRAGIAATAVTADPRIRTVGARSPVRFRRLLASVASVAGAGDARFHRAFAARDGLAAIVQHPSAGSFRARSLPRLRHATDIRFGPGIANSTSPATDPAAADPAGAIGISATRLTHPVAVAWPIWRTDARTAVAGSASAATPAQSAPGRTDRHAGRAAPGRLAAPTVVDGPVGHRRAAEDGACGVRAAHIGPGQRGIDKTGAAEVGAAQFGPGGVGSPQIDPAQVATLATPPLERARAAKVASGQIASIADGARRPGVARGFIEHRAPISATTPLPGRVSTLAIAPPLVSIPPALVPTLAPPGIALLVRKQRREQPSKEHREHAAPRGTGRHRTHESIELAGLHLRPPLAFSRSDLQGSSPNENLHQEDSFDLCYFLFHHQERRKGSLERQTWSRPRRTVPRNRVTALPQEGFAGRSPTGRRIFADHVSNLIPGINEIVSSLLHC
jgi:hypothetical protein